MGQLRTNSKGNVDLHEFVLWWLVGEHQRSSESVSKKTLMWLTSKKNARQARRIAVHAISKKVNQVSEAVEKQQRKVTRAATKQAKKVERVALRQRKKILDVGARSKQRVIRAASKQLLKAKQSKVVRTVLTAGQKVLDLPSKLSQGRNSARLKAQDRKMKKMAAKKMAEFKKKQDAAAIEDGTADGATDTGSGASTTQPGDDPADDHAGDELNLPPSEEELAKGGAENLLASDQAVDQTLEQQEADAERALAEVEAQLEVSEK